MVKMEDEVEIQLKLDFTEDMLKIYSTNVIKMLKYSF